MRTIENEKVLVISPFEHYPLSQGTIARTYFLIKHLAKNNSVFFAYRGGGDSDSLPFVEQSLGNHPYPFLQLFNPLFFFRLWRMACKYKVDLIIVSHLWSSMSGMLLKLFMNKPLWIDTHNVEYIRFRRAKRLTWPLVALFEFIAYRMANHLTCVSDVDKAYLVDKLHIPEEKIHVAPNGADVQNLFARIVCKKDVIQQLTNQPEKPVILFFGSLSHQANADAVDIILDTIAPRLSYEDVSANIVIAGPGQEIYLRTHSAPLPDNVVFIGFVEDITAVIKSVDLIIVPLISGSGTRLKILESVACGKRVISTSIGAEGLVRQAFGDRLLVCDDWDEFTQQVENKLNEPDEPILPPQFAEMYDWEKIFTAITEQH